MAFEQKDPLKVGYSVYDMQQPYWQEYARGVQEAAEAAGAEFVLSDQKSSQETQVSGSLDLINQGISALVISPVQPAALPAAIDAAHEAKIPVLIGDVGAEGDYDGFVLSDNYEGGVLAAKYMAEQLADVEGTKRGARPSCCTPAPPWARSALRASVTRWPTTRTSSIVAELNGNDTVEGGFEVTRDTLVTNPDLVGIYATNDPEAIGANQALKQAGKNGVDDVFLVGFNGDAPALELIAAGEMAATIRQDPYGQGKAAVEAAHAAPGRRGRRVLRSGDPVDLLPGRGRDRGERRHVHACRVGRSSSGLGTRGQPAEPGPPPPRPTSTAGVTGPGSTQRTRIRTDP